MKRIIWTGVGYSLGIGSSVYVQRRVRRTVERYAPAKVRGEVADRSRVLVERSRDLAFDLRDAARDGVAAMRQVERELIDEFSPQRPVARRGPAHGSRPDRPRR